MSNGACQSRCSRHALSMRSGHGADIWLYAAVSLKIEKKTIRILQSLSVTQYRFFATSFPKSRVRFHSICSIESIKNPLTLCQTCQNNNNHLLSLLHAQYSIESFEMANDCHYFYYIIITYYNANVSEQSFFSLRFSFDHCESIAIDRFWCKHTILAFLASACNPLPLALKIQH